jgi:hypothetical protein
VWNPPGSEAADEPALQGWRPTLLCNESAKMALCKHLDCGGQPHLSQAAARRVCETTGNVREPGSIGARVDARRRPSRVCETGEPAIQHQSHAHLPAIRQGDGAGPGIQPAHGDEPAEHGGQ